MVTLCVGPPAHTLARLEGTTPDRRLIALMATLLQVCLGTVYAWSYFQSPVVQAFACSQSRAAWAFSLAICFLGLAAAWGGVNLPRFGPRRLAMAGGALYSLGWMIGGLGVATKSLLLFWAGYGVVGGIGLGLGYVTPVATVAKWFPDRKGLATGMVVMGFGFGALLMSKVLAPRLMSATGGNLALVFVLTGAIMACGTLITGWFMVDPPKDGRTVPPVSSPAEASGVPGVSVHALASDRGHAILSRRFAGMWLVFFCNIAAGIMLIGFQSPMMQALLKARAVGMSSAQLAAAGATLIAASSLFNGLGRLVWGGVSDRLGRAATFRVILLTQILAFVALGLVQSPWLFGVLVCYVLLCYGGGFGAMPAFVLDVFGPRRMPVVYGAMLTAWSAAGIAGPQLAAMIRDRAGSAAALYTFVAGAILLTVGLAAGLFLNDRQHS